MKRTHREITKKCDSGCIWYEKCLRSQGNLVARLGLTCTVYIPKEKTKVKHCESCIYCHSTFGQSLPAKYHIWECTALMGISKNGSGCFSVSLNQTCDYHNKSREQIKEIYENKLKEKNKYAKLQRETY